MAFGRSREDKRKDADAEGTPHPEATPTDFGDAGPDSINAEVAKLQAERDDLNQKFLRTLADYQNSQRRVVANEREAKQQGVTSVVLNVVTVLTTLIWRPQDPAKATAESIMSGVKVIRDELMRVLQTHGVKLIESPKNGQFDPSMHQAVMQVEAPDVAPGSIVATLQPGFMLNDRVIRPATVTVAKQAEGNG